MWLEWKNVVDGIGEKVKSITKHMEHLSGDNKSIDRLTDLVRAANRNQNTKNIIQEIREREKAKKQGEKSK